MVVPLYNTVGDQVGEVELPADIFEAPINGPLMHQALVRQQANRRRGTHSTKSRGEVNRSKSKWYRQKGTGRARHGSKNANLFVGGGVAHGPRQRKYTKKMPRKMRRAALCSALSCKALEDQIVVLDALEMAVPKTKGIVEVLENLGLTANVLILLPMKDEVVELSARNLPHVKTLSASYLNVRDLLQYDQLLMSQDALQMVESILG
jgi:large subunit ribosomal protein L4